MSGAFVFELTEEIKEKRDRMMITKRNSMQKSGISFCVNRDYFVSLV